MLAAPNDRCTCSYAYVSAKAFAVLWVRVVGRICENFRHNGRTTVVCEAGVSFVVGVANRMKHAFKRQAPNRWVKFLHYVTTATRQRQIAYALILEHGRIFYMINGI